MADIHTIVINGWTVAVRVPDGDLGRAEVSPYTRFDKIGLSVEGVLDLLRAFEQLPPDLSN